MKLFVSPHNDDAVLFGAFSLMRYRPVAMTVLDSYVQPKRGHAACSASLRRAEDCAAISGVLNLSMLFGGVPDDLASPEMEQRVREVFRDLGPVESVWLPAVEESGHDHHNLIGRIGLEVFSGAEICRYLTYTRNGGKSTGGAPVPCSGTMARKKLQALACYQTQIEIDALGCWPHFLGDQTEYLAA